MLLFLIVVLFETVIHIFFECVYVQKIWKALAKWFGYFHSLKIKFTVELCIFNNYNKRNANLVNNTILITKFFIYRCKTQGNIPVFQNLISEIAKNKTVEFFIASKNDQLYKFARRWDNFDVFS